MISFEKSVGGVVFRKRGDTIMYLLLHYRPSGKSSQENGGHWDFPKGHQEKGENDHETLVREIQEETGLNDLKILPQFKSQIRYFYRAGGNEEKERRAEGKFINVAKKVVYYLAETNIKNVKLSFEHTGSAWLCFPDALVRTTYPNGKSVLKKANKFLQSF